jgi:hypothetical protein
MQDTDLRPATEPAAALADWVRLEQTPGVGAATVRLRATRGNLAEDWQMRHRVLARLRKSYR